LCRRTREATHLRHGAAIAVSAVRKSFEGGRVPALRDISFEIEPGELVALTGASGSGKSTLLNLIGALDTPDSGTVIVDGQSLDRLASASDYRASTVGFVFQAHNLLPTLTASENVQMAMFGKRPRKEREARAAELLAEVGLAGRVDARPAVLSGGERQRVAIARALANEPRVLLADEPTGALDSATGAQVLELLQELRRLHGMTTLLVTNDETVAAFADRVLRLRDGVILPPEAGLKTIRGEAPRSETGEQPATSDREHR
jgi:putative ABC transport system ATP-binding protein